LRTSRAASSPLLKGYRFKLFFRAASAGALVVNGATLRMHQTILNGYRVKLFLHGYRVKLFFRAASAGALVVNGATLRMHQTIPPTMPSMTPPLKPVGAL
jgi:hypothetical protein